MSDIYEKFSHAGLDVEIFYDTDSEGPDSWEDDAMFLVGFNRREFWVQRKGFELETVRNLLNGCKDEDGEVDDEAKAIEAKYYVFGLEAYIHSGVALYLSGGCGVDRQWDVSQVGAVFIQKSEFKTEEGARLCAKSLLKTWNDYLSGQVFGYIVKDTDGEHLDSCWGFYGTDHVIEEAKRAAGYCARAKREKRQAQLKTWIKNRVPLEKRVFNN
jgi:hypothetical protein